MVFLIKKFTRQYIDDFYYFMGHLSKRENPTVNEYMKFSQLI